MKKLSILSITIILALAMSYFCIWNNENTDVKSPKPDNPLEREEWRLARKGGFTDPFTIMKARENFMKKFKIEDNLKDSGINNWTPEGPFGVGGRVRSFVVDPNNNNHIHIGSVGGGIWETNNGGSTWSQVDDFLATLAIADMEYDPFNNTTIYASTGEGVGGGGAIGAGAGGAQPGVGIFKSTNNGNTWTLLPPPPLFNFFWVNDIVLDPNNQDWIYAVTTNSTAGNTIGTNAGQIFRSQDGGVTWDFIANTLSRALDIKIDPFNSNNIIVGCENHMYRSTNAQSVITFFNEITGGNNQPTGSAGRYEISFCPSNNGRVYACMENEEIWRSEDSGATWTQRTATGLSTVSWFTNVIWVDPNNSNRLIAGGVDLYRSTNGGASFTKISDWVDDINGNSGGGNNSIHADNHMIIPYTNYSSSNPGVYIANDGGLYSTNNIWTVSENSGWISDVGNLSITECYGGAASPDGVNLIAGAQDNSFSVSMNSGTTWNQPTTGDGAYAAIDYNNNNIMYANLNNNQIRKSTDGGVTWNFIAAFTNPIPGCSSTGCTSGGTFFVEDNPLLISYFTMDPNDPDNILVGCRRLWRNNDAGDANDWSAIKPTIPGNSQISAIDVDFGNSARIWVGYGNGTLERTTNTGITWSGDVSPTGIPSPAFVTDVCINPNNSNQVIVSYGGYNTDNLFYSSNANSSNPTWSNISPGIAIQINSIEWHNDNQGWIYIGTDFGILASENRGNTWSITPLFDDNEGPVNTEVSQLFWASPTSSILYAATHGRGIWKSNPLRDFIYVDKNQSCIFPNLCFGTELFPFNNFSDALQAAGHGSTIVFLSSGDHEEIPLNASSLIIEKRINIVLENNGTMTPLAVTLK